MAEVVDQPMTSQKYDRLVEVLSGLQGLNQADVLGMTRLDLELEVEQERKKLQLEVSQK